MWGPRWHSGYKALRYKSEAGVIEIFHDIKSFRTYYDPEVDSASNRNEYQVYILEVKAVGAEG